MIIYVYSKCSTCQKALSFLTQKKIAFTRREITETPPSLQELQTMLDYKEGDIKKLFNSSGQLYREWQLSEKLKSLSSDEALTLLSQHGMLVKRPFLLGEGIGLTGFNEKEWESLVDL
ncbi:putative arsenate reductase [Candidatus Protochlamydia naegleriophila]|uniref:Putative arsenate reductase n=1 Tax=Candidatus Protochlamydia naegleriophila TaxID=389348 RepID=A0A0U5J7R5_9BACT|nr:arsenate reductase family protein [Candidatus Protochlamydia naegleriophila]CUI16121.1 putative arsenate reductase [Candidatus Protochlamydia naegleriophila]